MTTLQHNSRVVGVSRGRSHTFSKDSRPSVAPGSLGENITTIGIDVLSLPRDTQLHIGPSAVVKVTGLRNPCKQLDGFQQGLTQAVLERTPSGKLVRKCGIMSVVLFGGEVEPGDKITVVLPEGMHHKLEPV